MADVRIADDQLAFVGSLLLCHPSSAGLTFLAQALAIARAKPAGSSAEEYVELLRQSLTPGRRDAYYIDGVSFWQRRYDREHRLHLSLRSKLQSGGVVAPPALDRVPPLKTLPAIDLIVMLRDAVDQADADRLFNAAAVEVVGLLNKETEQIPTVLPLLVSVIKERTGLDQVVCRNLALHLLQIMVKRSRHAEVLLSALSGLFNHLPTLVPAIFNSIVDDLVRLVQGKHTKRALCQVEQLCRLLQTMRHTDTERKYDTVVKVLHRYDALERCIWQVGAAKRWIRF